MSAGYNNSQAEYEQQSFGYDVSSGNPNMGFQNTEVSFSGPSTVPSKTSFFSNSSQSKYEDLKQMLESSKELSKLEAMKRIITMVAKGRSADSARELFPHVVKNVVTKNSELKKLVYLYLVRYAEQEPDLALLSIATFQHSLKDPNPLIRGSAIRVLSSIRVPMIAPIVLIAIEDCANDMSPYVRKIAAHAIPKLYSLDPGLKKDIVEIINRLLHDKVPLVLGSAVAAFEEICPERIDLVHENYRKLCALLVDVDEWGQIIIINMLMRYARTQFLNPNRTSSEDNQSTKDVNVDPDHMHLLRSCKPLLQSRNSGVVLSVIQLYLALAPQFELSPQLVRPLIRLLHSYREIQLVILKSIVTLTSQEFNDKSFGVTQNVVNGITNSTNNQNEKNGFLNDKKDSQKQDSNDDSDDDDDDDEDIVKNYKPQVKTIKGLFEPFLKSFFVKAKDSTQTKILKLEILTNLSNSSNISLILREFQAYIMNYQDEIEFMTSTIESIGQCASRIKEIAPICLNGLVSLLSNRNETIVAQSIVVIRSQIINKEQSVVSLIVRQIVRLMDKISAPQARATILWIVAEFCSRNDYSKKIAPDVLRKIAKSFCSENDLVKLQALNLAAKLSLTSGSDDSNHERLKVLIGYIFNLAKYDTNYDVRDRGRFLKNLLNDHELAKKILLVPKMVPIVGQGNNIGQTEDGKASGNFLSPSSDSIKFRVGTLSHFVGKKANDYEELPDWPDVQPNPNARKPKVIEKPVVIPISKAISNTKKVIMESDDDSENGDEEDEVTEEDEEQSDVDEEDDDEEDEEDEDEEDEDEEEDDEEEEDEESEYEDEESEEDEEIPVVKKKNQQKEQNKNISNIDLLSDMGDLTINDTNPLTNSTSGLMIPTRSESSSLSVSPTTVASSAIETVEKLKIDDKNKNNENKHEEGKKL